MTGCWIPSAWLMLSGWPRSWRATPRSGWFWAGTITVRCWAASRTRPRLFLPPPPGASALALNEGQPFAKRSSELKGWTLHIWSEEDGFASHFMGL
ncbi:MAG: hypothetical protein WDM79_04195 [Terricaulis sp.]